MLYGCRARRRVSTTIVIGHDGEEYLACGCCVRHLTRIAEAEITWRHALLLRDLRDAREQLDAVRAAHEDLKRKYSTLRAERRAARRGLV